MRPAASPVPAEPARCPAPAVGALLDAATLPINPKCDLRGSGLTVIDNWLPGQCACRGCLAHALAVLAVREASVALAPVLVGLLTNAAGQRVLGRPDPLRANCLQLAIATLPLGRLLAELAGEG